ncbi:MAG TPA: EAL domain-containing protein [Steroidobacteraceae bacterium]|nr:EAL domain-containing protein [Steroidobacteraceae bacterium]
MRRRMVVVITLGVLLALAAAAWIAVLVILTDRDADLADRVSGLAPSFARQLQSRLQMANALVQYLSSSDAGADGAALRQRVLGSDTFGGVLFVPWQANVPDVDGSDDSDVVADANLPGFSTADRLTLSGGQSLLKVVPSATGGMTIYLVHVVSSAGARQVAYFELVPNWFWQGAEGAAGQTAIAVVDTAGRIIFRGGELPLDAFRKFALVAIDGRDPLRPVQRNWLQDDISWRAAVVRLDFAGAAHLRAMPWNVVCYARLNDARPMLSSFVLLMLPMLLLAIACAGLVSWFLGRRWEPVLGRLHAALAALQEGRFQRVDTEGSIDCPRAVAQGFNLALSAVEQRIGAQARLAQIDRLLLENMDVEQALDAVLPRICAVTSTHVAAVLLIDRNAPGHARSFIGGADGADYPVTRIPLEPGVIASLTRDVNGLSVSEADAERHVFLAPLHALGATYFHIWPIGVHEQITAILSVGSRGTSALPQAQTVFGAQCAERLRIALSNRARDEQLYRQAHFDSLTALPNRLLFRDRLSQELANTADGSQRGAVLYVDLDHFKKVNDSVGHSAGDQLLTIVAQRLRSCVKDGDTVARLGGDEFTVILRHLVSVDTASEIAQRIIDTVQRPVSIAGRDQFVRASIGITLFPDDGNTIEDLMRNADLAMYQAKDGGRSRAVFFDRMMARAQVPLARSGLFRALRRREFSLYYQPQYAMRGGELVGLEGFLRWQNPHGGVRLPKDFVPTAEESGLIVDIGAWALESACHQLAMWRDQGIAPPRLALNVSVQQLRTPDFAELVASTLQRHALQPQQLEFEISESVFAEEEARLSLRQLAALGVRLALGQFGRGESSLSYLRQYPVHAIKVDRRFMQEVPESQQASTLVATIIHMAHALDKQVIAEGVETMGQLDFLRERGCDVAQGFVLARPSTVAEVSEVLAARQPAEPWLQSAAS